MWYYILGLLIAPLFLCVSVLTKGAILPTITSKETWSIEYIPILFSSIAGVFFAFKGFSSIKKKWLSIFIVCFNVIIFLFFLCALIFLWGDKY